LCNPNAPEVPDDSDIGCGGETAAGSETPDGDDDSAI
jgi:hypothetical protein